jgi:secondary thiamine-phosphate synthase enzyme
MDMVKHFSLRTGPYKRGFHLITNDVLQAVDEWPESGMLQVFIQHTSAGLCINENADASVRHDFELFFNQLAPEDLSGLTHDMEGPDDMPAHIKSALTGVTVMIPIIKGRPALGTWQGIYLCEYRNNASQRDLIISITG